MDITVSTQRQKKIHPHKFTLWVAIGSILMMFAGLTSAFIVKSNQAGWQQVVMPKVFWISTVTILISSITVQMALRSFKQREMSQYRLLIGITLLLGIAFVSLQWIGVSAVVGTKNNF
jgi:cytochrome c oxidase subunit 3